ncbi:hypothetical protein HDV01_003551 [Terramyces sp. JEL0728]|nr:hypothetical protein HDV01_003551 [Terramyces sp. JEL0728]
MQELEIEDVDFHERFPKFEPGFPNLFVAIFFCIKTVYFSIVAILRYFIFGPLCKQWSFLYHLSSKRLLDMDHKGRAPDVKTIQNGSMQPSVLLSGQIIDEYYPRSQAAIDFLKKHAPGEWPAPANDLGQVHGEWLICKESNQNYVVYLLHGGAYILCSAKSHRMLAREVAIASKSKVYSINYRLAPQNPYPCALIDAVSGYLHLLKRFHSANIVFQGDSAGGGLVIAALQVIRDMGLPAPAGGYCLSPWLDLTHSCPSIAQHLPFDYLPLKPIEDPRLQDRKNYYTIDSYLKHPYVSPLWAKDLSNLPQLLFQCGSVEMLYDEIISFSKHFMRDNQVSRITCEVYKGHVHVFHVLVWISPGARAAIDRAGKWIQQVTGRVGGRVKDTGLIHISHNGHVRKVYK